jgi:hypothetical protein
MKKLLFSTIGILILSMCVLSCSKKEEEEEVTPILPDEILTVSGFGSDTVSGSKKELAWVISEEPDINIRIPGDYASEGDKVSDTLKLLFRQGDKYTFEADGSCKIRRGSSTAPRPKNYTLKDGYLEFEGYIKFKTDVSENKKTLTLKAGDAEIRGIIEKELPKQGIKDDAIKSILKFITGNAKLVLEKREIE